MPKPLALIRPPAASFARAVSTHPLKDTIDPGRALEQHKDYAAALKEAGAVVRALDPLDAFPDSTFIEDNAVVLEGRAYLGSMRELSRRGEPALLQEILEPILPVEKLQPPVFLDGGDVMATDQGVYIGHSQRTNPEACQWLKDRLKSEVFPVRLRQLLHLKTSATYLGSGWMVIYKGGCDFRRLQGFHWIEVEKEEAAGANCLAIGKTVIMPAGLDRVAKRIEMAGFRVRPVNISEFQKADGGVSCLSLIIPH